MARFARHGYDRGVLRRVLLPVTVTVTVALALLLPAASGGAASQLAGSWSGTMSPTGSGVRSSYAFNLTISSSGRGGTWRSERCNGTLTYLGRTDGYARFREVLKSGPCTGGGVDWVKRRGSGLYVSFKSKSGAKYNSRGTLRRS